MPFGDWPNWTSERELRKHGPEVNPHAARWSLARLASVPLALLVASCAGLAQPSRPPDAPAPPAVVLASAVLGEGLSDLAEANHLDLAAEARRIAGWIASSPDGRRAPILLVGTRLKARTGELLPVSPTMATALTQLSDWYGLTAQTLAHPITHEELKEASLSSASVARISDLFADCIRAGVAIDGRWIVPETGGEATLDGELRLHAMPDPAWPTVQELVRRAPDEDAVAALWREREPDMLRLDAHGILRSALARRPVPGADSAAEVRRAAFTVARNAAETYSIGPEEQLALILKTTWRGRYVGLWHTHPPHLGDGGWRGGDVPSFEDMQNAVANGQFLTLSFQPDGFDLYDAASLSEEGRVDLSLLKLIRFRSEAWRERFAALLPPKEGGPAPTR